LDHARKTAKELVEKYDLIAYEDLNIRGMVQGLNFGKSVSDAAWKMFISCLQSKAEEAGKWAVGVNPRGTSQRCSGCSEVVPKTLSERVHRCPHCGLELDRDHNAALNVVALGWSAVSRVISKEVTLAEAS
jgi:putative transposase